MRVEDRLQTSLHQWKQRVRERSDQRKLREQRRRPSRKPDRRYERTNEEIAAAVALAQRITGEHDLPEPEVSRPVAPQGPAYLTDEEQLTRRLEAVPKVDTTKAVQLKLI